MKYPSVHNLFNGIIIFCLSVTTFTAHAAIEKTIISNYDLALNKSARYELMLASTGNQVTITLVPMNTENNTPSIFKATSCVNRSTGTTKHGELHFSSIVMDKNDIPMANLGYFVSEHNLNAWWIHLDKQQILLFNPDNVGLIVSDGSTFTPSTDVCHSD